MKKVLYLANVFSHFTAFHRPFIGLLQEMGADVHAAASDNDEYSFQEIREMGVVCHDISIPRNPLSFSIFRAAHSLKELLISNDYDFIHVHTPVAAFLGRFLARKLPATRVIYTAHGFHFYKGASLLNWLVYFPVEYIARKWTDVLICMNKEDFNMAIKMGFIPGKNLYFVHGVGLDISDYANDTVGLVSENSADIQPEVNRRFVICVGELSKRKNQQMLIRAWALVIRNVPDVKLCLVGVGNQESLLKKMTKDLQVDSTIQFMGFRRDIPRLMRQAEMLVLVSKHEGLPRCIMEAMAAGKPVVASDVRGNSDLVENGDNGFLIGVDDVQTLSKRIITLLEDETLMQNMGCSGYTKIQEYKIERVIEEMRLVYQRFIS